MSTTEAVSRIPLCGGTLTGWVRRPPPPAYDGDSGPAEFWAVFERDGRQTEIRAADRLFAVLVDRCGTADLAAEVAPVVAPLAELTALLLDEGRALTNLRLYDFIEKSHALSLRDNLPRIEGPFFRFLLGQFPAPRISHLFEIEVDLRTGAMTKRTLP